MKIVILQQKDDTIAALNDEIDRLVVKMEAEKITLLGNYHVVKKYLLSPAILIFTFLAGFNVGASFFDKGITLSSRQYLQKIHKVYHLFIHQITKMGGLLKLINTF